MILDIILGKRIYLDDFDFGRFHSTKKLKHSPPILWMHATKIAGQSAPCQLQLEGDKKEIYPDIKNELIYFEKHFNTVIKAELDKQVREIKDLLSEEKLEYEFSDILGTHINKKAVLEFVGKEVRNNYVIRFAFIEEKIRSLIVM